MRQQGKRNRGQKDIYSDGKSQRRRTEKEDKDGDGLIAYRILCPATVIGSVIGKAGKVINLIRQETGAKVKVVDPFPGAKDRVITIYCYVKEKTEVEVDEEYNTVPLCPSQDALLRTHAAISNALASVGDYEKQQDREECSILVPASQSANVIGKSGTTIKKLRSKTRANIKVIPKDGSDPNHSCAMDFDNFIQITGDPESVKRALFAVSAIMYKFPPKEEISLDTTIPEVAPTIIIPADMLLNPAMPASGFYSDPLVPPRSAPSLIDTHALDLPVPGFGDTGSMWSLAPCNTRSEELTVRVLCPSDSIGRVIGKGGSIIKSIRKASGAHIEVDDTKVTKDKCGGCVITITSTESLEDLKSKAVEAVLLLQEKINEDAENVTIRLIIPSKNIGCIIGKSGSIINEIRKRTRADIRISKGQKPKSVDEGDESVEVSGEVKHIRDALVQIVLRLRDDALKDEDGAKNLSVAPDPLYTGSSALSLPPVLHTVPSANPLGYEPRSESGRGVDMFSSGRGIDMFSSGHGVDMLSSGRGVDMLSSGRGADMLSSGRGADMLSSGRGVDMFSSGRGVDMLSSGHYKYKSLSMGDDVYGSSYSSKLYGGGLLPSSTLEILVPGNAVNKVLGKNGANLSNIRQISGAVIEISEPKSSRGDRLAHISGTPEQKRSAENLIQAFIMAT